jgi:hypothetical protein
MLLLLEDLKDFRSFSIGQHLSHEDAMLAVKMIARVHALYWNKPVDVCQYLLKCN